MIKIDQDRLRVYMKSFVDFEIAVHGIDPQVSLFGTTLRRERDEGYKLTVYERFHTDDEGTPMLSYLDRILNALPGGNLVDYHKKRSIEEQLKAENSQQQYEAALQKLYESNDDAASFELLAGCFGYRFDLLSFLFFLKDKNRYVPVRSKLFDQRFPILGAKTKLADHCTWENYQDVNRVMLEIWELLCNFLQTDVELLDAHSFFWILPYIEEFITTGEVPESYWKNDLRTSRAPKNSKPESTSKNTYSGEYKHENEINLVEYPNLPEGSVKEISITTFERNQRAINACKRHYLKRDGKLVCQICGFDFGAFYGEEYENMIHIHHIIPLAAIREKYKVNPVEDLLPICPNCHMILHRINKNEQRELSAKELITRIEQMKNH